MKREKILKELIIVFILTLILTGIILKINYMKFEIPPAYIGDGWYLSYNVKNIQDFGWWFKNPNVGAPFGADLYDYPFYFDSLFLFVFKIILCFCKSWGKAINIFYIGIFPLTSVTSYYTMRKLKINKLISFLGSLCFTFLPYRFFRGAAHFYLSCYFFIPLMFLFLYNFQINTKEFKFKEFIKNKKNIYIVLFLFLISISGIYYTFFFCFFLFISFITKIDFKNRNKLNSFYEIMYYYVIILFSIILVYIPGFIHKITNEKNLEAPIRFAKEADMYSLTIARLFISSKYQQMIGFHKLKSSLEDYLQYLPRGEGTGVEYLGIIGIVGILYLLLILFKKNTKYNMKINLLKNLNISAILLGTSSGFGLLFAIIVSPQIRAYNRISVFIAFFGILTVCILLNNFYKNINNNFYKKIFTIIIIIIFGFTILEQIPNNITYKDSRKTYIKEFNSDKKFVQNIEKTLGKEGMVYQLPYHKFPEGGLGPQDYQLFKGYFHSKNLKWSFGGYRGRKSDMWNRDVANLQIEQLLKKISIVGFNGIYLDRSMYKNNEYINIENKIKQITGVNPYISDDKKLIFFDLRNYSNMIKSHYTSEQLIKERNKNLLIISEQGIYSLEIEKDKKWRWTEKDFEFIISNQNPNSEFSLEADIFSGYPQDSELLIDYNGEKQKIIINDKGTKLKLNYKLSIGKNIIKFTTNAPKINAPGDNRKMYLRFENLKINE